jgi:hypothetical protein
MGDILMNCTIMVATVIMAIATVGIWVFTKKTYDLHRALESRQDEQEKRFNDFLEALTIATVLSATPEGFETVKKRFFEHYTGSTSVLGSKKGPPTK